MMPLKVYLDNCSIQRPLDNQTQARIRLEAEAVLSILSFVDSEEVELIASEISVFETVKITEINRREFLLGVIAKSKQIFQANEITRQRAKELSRVGIKALDALHLSAAEQCNADYFCTCDDRFYKKAKTESKIKVLTPIELLSEIENESSR
jgi:predicted nucleic acid-binding protein